MKRFPSAESLYTGTVLLAAGAIVWTALLLAREPAYRRTLARRNALESRLVTLEREAAAMDALRQPFEKSGGGAGAEQLAQDLFGRGGTARITTEKAVIADRLGIHTVTVDFPAVPFETLMAGIQAAEALRPPLKLTACVLEAAPGKSGEGRARLTFERIEWR